MAKSQVEPTLFADEVAKPKAEKKASAPAPKSRRQTARAIARPKAEHVPTQQVVPYQQPKTMLEVIAEAARNPAVDVQKMKELLAIKREEEALIAERVFTEALAAAQAEMPRLVRDAKSDKHRYVKLETVTKALDPIIAKHGFTLSFGMGDSPIPDHYRIAATLQHIAGHKRFYFIDLPADTKGPKGGDNKTAVQGVGSTISYGRRYLTNLIFNVAVVGEDNDGAKIADCISKEQVEEIVQMCAERRITKDQFLKAARVDAIEDIKVSRFESAKTWIKQKEVAA